MAQERPLYTLYKNLKAQNYDVPDDYDRFENALTLQGQAGASNRHKIYDSLKSQNFDVPDTYERFYSALFTPISKTSSRAKGGSVPLSDADKRMFISNSKAIVNDAVSRLKDSKRYKELRQQQAKRKNDFGRVDLGTNKNIFGDNNDNVVQDGIGGDFLTSDGGRTKSKVEAQAKQGVLDKQANLYTEAVDKGDIPSVFDVRDKNGNYDLQENIGTNGTHLTEEGARNQLDRKLDYAYKRKKELEQALYDNMDRYGGFVLLGDKNSNERLDERLKLTSALDQVKDEIGSLEALKSDSWYGDMGQALSNTVFRANSWDFGLSDFNLMAQMERIKTKMDNDIPLSGSEKALLQSKSGADAAAALTDEKKGWLYRWTKIAGQSLPFMVDFYLTGGYGGITKAASKGALKFAAKRGMGKISAAILKNTGVVAADIVGSYAMAGTEQALKTGADIMQRHMGQLYQDEDGNYKFGTFDENGNLLHEGGESIGKALYKGLTAAALENYTEKIFGHDYGIKKSLVSGLEKIGMTRTANFFKNVGKNAWYAGAKKNMKKFGIDGFFEEVMEEEINIPLNALLVGDNKMSDLLDKKHQLDIIGGMALSVGSMYAVNAPYRGAYNRAQFYRFKNILGKADVTARNAFGTEEDGTSKWDAVREQIDNTPNEKMGAVLHSILESKDTMSKEQIDSAIQYGIDLMKMRGYNLAKTEELTAKKTTGEQDTPEEKRQEEIENAYSDGQEADDSVKHDYQLEQNDKANVLAAKLGITPEQLHDMSDEQLDSMTGQSDELDQAIYEYQDSTARYQGVLDAANDKVDMAAHQAAQQVDQMTDIGRGTVRNATIKGTNGASDYGVYIISGNLATHDDGTIDISNSDKMIVYFDPTTGRKETAEPLMFSSVGEENVAEEVKEMAITQAKEQAIKEIAGIIDGTVGVGSTFSTTDEQGNETQYEILADNGDGSAMITIDGNVDPNPHTFEELQQLKDAEDLKRLEAAKQQRAEMEVQRDGVSQTEENTQEQPTETEEPSALQNIDLSKVVNANGNIVRAEVTDNRGDDMYPDAVDVFLIDDKGAFARLVVADEDGNLTTVVAKKKNVKVKDTIPLEEYRSQMATSSTAVEGESGMNAPETEINDEAAPIAEETKIETPKFEDGTDIPVDKDGEVDFSQTDAAHAAEWYDNNLGDDAEDTLSEYVKQAKTALTRAKEKKVKGNKPSELVASKKEKEAAIADAQAKYDSAVSIRDAYNERRVAKQLDSHDGRMSLLQKAKNKFSRLKNSDEWKNDTQALWNDTIGSILHRMYDGLSVNVFDHTPQTLEEYVSSSIAPYSLNYEGTDESNGVKQETGLARKDFTKSHVLAAEGKGTTVDKFVHKLWDNRPSQFENATDQDIRNALISLITSDMNAYDMQHVIENNRIAQAEKEIEDEKMSAENAAFEEEQRKVAEEEARKQAEAVAKERKDDDTTADNEYEHLAPLYDFENDENLSEEERKNMMLRNGETFEEYRNRNGVGANGETTPLGIKVARAYIQQKYGDKLADIDAIFGMPMKVHYDGWLMAEQMIKVVNANMNDFNAALMMRNDNVPLRSEAILGYLDGAAELIKARHNAEKLGLAAFDSKGNPVYKSIVELANWAKEQGLEVYGVSATSNYADLYLTCKDGFGVTTLVPDHGDNINMVFYFPEQLKGVNGEVNQSRLGQMADEFNDGRDALHSAEVDIELTDGAQFYNGDTAKEFRDFVNKKTKEENKPFGEQLDESEVPFSQKEGAVTESKEERAKNIEDNRVENMKTVDNIISKKTRKAFERIAKMMGSKIQFQYSDKIANGWYDPEKNTIYLSLSSAMTDGAQFIFGHEMTHEIKNLNPSAYEELRDLVKDSFTDDAYTSLVDDMRNRYAETARSVGREDLAEKFLNEADDYFEEEFVADEIGKMIDDANYAHTLSSRMSHPLLSALHDILLKIKHALLGTEYEDGATMMLRGIEQAYVKTMNRDAANIATATGEQGTSYSLRKKPAPKNTIKVYKLMRLSLEDNTLNPLFIDSKSPTKLNVWYDADSPNLEQLRSLPSGVHIVNNETGEAMSFEDWYNAHTDLYTKDNGKVTKMGKFPSKEALQWATDNNSRFIYIEETKNGQKRFDGENRKYWNLGINGSGSVSTFSMRPGWHAGSLPTMRQIGKGKEKNLRDDNFVWVEGEISADVDYNDEAQKNPDKDIPNRIPEDGYYLKATNANKAASQADRVGWYVAGSFKANRIMSDAECRKVIDDWNAAHPDLPVEYDYERESGKMFNANTMRLEDKNGKDYPRFSIRTYHGSQASFDHFDHSFMGSGEGAQAYGWGTYVSEVEGIAKAYAKQNAKKHTPSKFTYKGEPMSFETPTTIYQVALDMDKYNISAKEAISRMIDDNEKKLSVADTPFGKIRANQIQSTLNLLKDLNPSDFKIEEDYDTIAQNLANTKSGLSLLEDELKDANSYVELYSTRLEDAQKELAKAKESGTGLGVDMYESDVAYYSEQVKKYKDKVKTKEGDIEDVKTKVDALQKKLDSMEKPRNLYTVEIPDDNGDNYLDWDGKAPDGLKEKVLDRLYNERREDFVDKMRKAGFNDEQIKEEADYTVNKEEMADTYLKHSATGGGLYRDLSYYLGEQKKASLFLKDMGIDGVKVIAKRNTGGNKEGKMNYVIFDENNAKIINHEKFSLKSEKAKIIADAKKNGTFLKAPNGKDSKLSEEKWATVRTGNFKKWFGDWEKDPENASKVVDENGEPLVVYHGRSTDFNTFEHKEGVRFIMGLEDKVKSEGFFFSPNKEFAAEYASNASRHRGGKANIVPCFLDIRKPMDLTAENYDETYEDVTGWEYQVGMDSQSTLWDMMDEEGMADKMKAKGYDGAIFVEEVDENYEPTQISYCALDPNQIKSADNNNGDFSSDNNDIRYSLDKDFHSRLKSAIGETNINPSDAQKESGNYKKGHIKFGGYDFTIENPKGSERKGVDSDGKQWSVKMHDTYGYVRGKIGKDGDHLDMFINDSADLDKWNGNVYVVDQVNQDGSFDEHKVMYGYNSEDEAKASYLANYSKGWKGLGNITGVDKETFDKWLDNSKRKTKPFADYNDIINQKRLSIKTGGLKPLFTVDGKPVVLKEDNGKVDMNYRTWQDEKKQVRETLINDAELDEDEADALIAQADVVADTMKGFMQRYPRFRDFQYSEAGNRPIIRDNGDYLSFDYSFNCIKKDAINSVMDKLVSLGKGGHLGVTQVEAIKKILQKHGFLTPCVMCYVEGKRKVLKQSKMDEAKWNAVRKAAGLEDKLMGEPTELSDEQRTILQELADGKGLERVENYTTKNGEGIMGDSIKKIATLMLNSDMLRGNMNYEWMMSPSSFTEMYNKFGNTGLMEYLSIGQYRGKQLLEAVPFSLNSIPRDIYLKMFSNVELKDRGGLRQFSYEDARAMMFFDYYTQFLLMQGARSPEHLYTKRPFMPEMFGKTGAMINQSLIVDVWKGDKWHQDALGLNDADYQQWLRENAGFIPRGALNENDKNYVENNTELVPAWSVESFPIDIAMDNAHNKEYKGTVGNVVVAPSVKFIKWALDNPDIHMVLAYHAAGSSPIMKSLSGYDMATVMDDGYHTLGTDGKAIKYLNVNDIGLEINGGALQWNRLLRHNGYDARKAAQAYLDYCRGNGLTPMFNYDGVVDNPNYYKMLTDFRMYDEDGKNIKQKGVKAVLPDNWQDILNKYLEQEQGNYNQTSSVTLSDDIMKEINAATKYTSIEADERNSVLKLLGDIYGKDNVDVLSDTNFDKSLDDATEKGRAQMLRDGGGMVYGFTAGGKIVLNENVFNANTPLHEHAHIYMKVLQAFNPRLYERGKELWNGSPLWNECKADLERIGDDASDDRVFSECMARFTGAESEKIIANVTGITDKNWIQKALTWMKEMWDGIRSAFTRWTKDDLDSLTNKQFARMPLRAFYDEKERKAYAKKVKALSEAGGMEYDVHFSLKSDELKNAQLAIINETNPMLDDYHTGIRKVEDIKSFDEAYQIAKADMERYDDEQMSSYPDLTDDIIEDAINSGKITVYSSKPIKNGNFVTPSRMQAEDYAGGGKVYEKTIPTKDVAWIDIEEGQYAKVDDVRFSLKSLADGSEGSHVSLANVLGKLTSTKKVDDAMKDAIDNMPLGWKMANKKAIHIAEALATNRKDEINGRVPKFSLKGNSLIKAGTYFSGGGLVEEGLKGVIDPVVAVEYDEKISGVYRNNFGQHIVTADVRDVDPAKLVSKIDGDVEFFHASPVCKNYSKAKANHEEVELDKETAKSTADFINQIKPRVVTIENVKGYKDSEAMKIIADALDKNGYKWDSDVYNAADYGGYTNRERLIVRAVRDGELPSKPKKLERKSGWYEAVEDIMPTLIEKKNGVAPWMDMRLRADGIDWRNIDKPLYVMGSAYANGKIPHAFADELLPTLRTKSGDVIVMPNGKVYRATGRVLARVSGMSDDYKLPYSESLAHTIIGNGIPTQLTEHVIAPLLNTSSPRYSLRGSTSYDEQLAEWKKRNHLPEQSKPLAKPVRAEGESVAEFANRMVHYVKNQNLWKTAPKPTGFTEALEKWKKDNGLDGMYPPIHPNHNDFESADEYNMAVKRYRSEKEVWKDAPKPKDFDLSVDVEDMSKQIRNIRRSMLNQKDYDKRTVKAISDLVNTMLNIGWGDGLSRGKVERLLSAAKNATGANDVKKHIDNVMGILADNYLSRISKAYDNLINTNGVKADQSGVIKIGSLDVNGQNFLSEYKRAMNMDEDSINERIANLEDDSAKNPDNANANGYRLSGIEAAVMFRKQIVGNDADIADVMGQIKELTDKKNPSKADKELRAALKDWILENKLNRVQMYSSLLGNVQAMISDSKTMAKEFKRKIDERKNDILHRANLDMEGEDSTYYDTDSFAKRARNNSLLRAVMSPTYTFEQFLKFFGKHHANGEGYLYNYFIGEWHDAVDENQVYDEMNRENLDKKAKELFGKKFLDLVGIDGDGMKEMDCEVTDPSNKETGKRTIHLKQGQMLYIYLVNKETDGQMKLRSMGITESDVAAIEGNLDPKMKAIGEWLQDEYLPECQRRYQGTHTKYFGAPMKEVDNYFPLVINNRARNIREDVNQDTDAMSQLAGTSTGAIVSRRVNTTPLDIENADAIAVAYEHLKEMEEWSAMLPFRQDINTLLSYTHFRNQVTNQKSIAYGSGNTLWNEFKQTAQIAAGTYKPKVGSLTMDSRISKALGLVSMAKISGRLWTAIKQSQSALSFITESDPQHFIWNGVNPYGSWKWAYKNLPLFRKRVERMAVGDTRIKQFMDSVEKTHSIAKTIADIGMFPNILVDSVTCAVGARSVYQTELNKLLKRGYPKEKAEEKAMLKASLSYNTTQQSSEGAFVSPLQVDRTYVSAALSLFKNANYAYGRKKIEAVRGLAKTWKYWGEHKNAMVESMRRQIMEEDGLEADVADKIANTAYKRTFYHNLGMLLNYMTIMPISWALYKVLPYIIFGDDDDKKWKKAEDSVLQGLSTTMTDDYAIPFVSSAINAGLEVGDDGKPTFNIDKLKYQNLYINPATSDLANIYSIIGNQKWWAAANKFGMLGMQALIGFNPETVGQWIEAFSEYDSSNGNTSIENKIAFLKFINAPEASIRGLYIDELGLDDEDTNKVSLAELEKRYAERQMNRDFGFSKHIMSKEAYDAYIEKYKQSFEKKIQEKMDKIDSYDKKKADEIFNTTSDSDIKKMIDKKRTKEANGSDEKNGDSESEKKDKKIQEVYDNFKNSFDLAADISISVKNKALKKKFKKKIEEYGALDDAGKEIYKLDNPDFESFKEYESKYKSFSKEIKTLKEGLIGADNKKAASVMKEIRQKRDEFMKEQENMN